jgi:hypothetical protein
LRLALARTSGLVKSSDLVSTKRAVEDFYFVDQPIPEKS